MNDARYKSLTRSAYVATRVLDTPFWALYNMIPVILYKDLHASPWELALVIALKPLVSFLSIYWSSAINSRRDRLVSNIVWARVIGYLPFLLIPLIDQAWFMIFAFGLYMMLAVGIVPAWMELLKLNIPKETREKVFSYTQAFGYIGGGLLPFVLGWALDSYHLAWRWLFPIGALLGLTAFFFQKRILVPNGEEAETEPSQDSMLAKPWQSAWRLLKRRKDFRLFQYGFMIVGSGLMIIQPVLPIFFVDQLHLSYIEISVALTFFKGLGFAASSPLWSKWMHRIDPFALMGRMALVGCIFPICLLLAPWQISWLYVGYLFYGVMQSGSELIWNMSGPYFAKNEDSSVYTSVNVLGVGIRGAIVPALGSAMAGLLGAPMLLGVSGMICLSAVFAFNSFRIRSSERPLSASQNS